MPEFGLFYSLHWPKSIFYDSPSYGSVVNPSKNEIVESWSRILNENLACNNTHRQFLEY